MTRLVSKKIIFGALGAIAIAASVAIIPVNAAQNPALLSGLEINPTAHGGYNIVVKADKNISIEKKINAKNNIILDLKGVMTSESLNTIYNNVSGIDSVVFQPVAKDHVKIHLQGKNISASSVSVESSLLPSGILNGVKKKFTNETLLLNKPINSYAPIVKPEDTLQQPLNVTEHTNQNVSLATLANKVQNPFNSTNAGWLLSLIMFGMFLITNFIKPKAKKVNINLAGDYKEREMDLYKDLKKKEGLIGSGLGTTNRNFTKKSSLAGLGNASQANYGLNAYKKSSVDPYQKQRNVTKMRPESRITPSNSRTIADSRLQSKRPVPQKSPFQPKTNVAQKQVEEAKVNIDSVKFLESMAKIYEKSGRVDLAHGLHTNIKKARMQHNNL